MAVQNPVKCVKPARAREAREEIVLVAAEERPGEAEFLDISAHLLDVDADRPALRNANQRQRAGMRGVKLEIFTNQSRFSMRPGGEGERLRRTSGRLGEHMTQRRARQHEARAVLRSVEPVGALDLVMRQRQRRLWDGGGVGADIDEPEAHFCVRAGDAPPAETFVYVLHNLHKAFPRQSGMRKSVWRFSAPHPALNYWN